MFPWSCDFLLCKAVILIYWTRFGGVFFPSTSFINFFTDSCLWLPATCSHFTQNLDSLEENWEETVSKSGVQGNTGPG